LEDRLEIEKHEDVNVKGQFVAGTGKPNSGKGSRLLQHLNTRISIGTEVNFKSKITFNHILTKIIKKDGQYVYVDWLPQKEADSSKLTSKFNTNID
jgi:hypothetical protein